MPSPTVESGAHLRAVSSYVSQPNTPETDAMPKVMHTVNLSDGSRRQIMATDPCNAIEQVNRSLRENT